MIQQDNIARLSSLIDLERPLQQNAVRWALTRLIEARQCGVVLADEVGCGKTYEAMALFALLWHHYRETDSEIRRVLVLCKSSLLDKWHEELAPPEKKADPRKHGLKPYLTGEGWGPFIERFIDGLVVIENLNRAERMLRGKDGERFAGVQKGGKIQVPPGLYLVNHRLLYDSRRDKSRVLKYLYRTNWDLVIVDEAHHYGKGNKCDSIFAQHYQGLGRGVQPDFGAAGTLGYRHILLLTATPFELEPREMLNLLAIARVPKSDLEILGDLLKQYQKGLNTFYGLRALPPDNPRRKAAVEQLRASRVGGNADRGLQPLMQRYIVRNQKDSAERQYALVNRDNDSYGKLPFEKFDKLSPLVAEAPLVPFTGPHALFYLELRALIQEVIEARSTGEDARGTFVAMDLQQGLSSYPQLLKSSGAGKPRRLLERDSERARRLHQLISEWDRGGKLHPKVSALVEVVTAIIEHEIVQVECKHQEWFAKVVVFNKLVAGTASHLREQLESALQPLLEGCLERKAQASPFGSADHLRQAAGKLVQAETDLECDCFTRECQQRGEQPILCLSDLSEAGFEGVSHDTHAVQALTPYLENRARQPLFLINFLLHHSPRPGECETEALRRYLRDHMIADAIASLKETVDKYLDMQPDEDEERRLGKTLRDTGIRSLSLLREGLRSPELVARYDGTNPRLRESNRVNFNGRWNPLVLIVSRVGEEGIDLQRQARYILHYDLEWNPAKMEQREGRVDREGYRQDYQDKTEPIDVRFFLLKGTYEERIFHTVMQRDQWFQILMGGQRRQLGRLDSKKEDEDAQAQADADPRAPTDEAAQSVGDLAPEEKEAVMLDLRPPSAG